MTNERIVSADNPRLRLVRKLASKKYRDELGMFVAEGRNMVRESIRFGAPVEFILMADGPGGDDLEGDLGITGKNIRAYRVAPALFDRLTDAGRGVGVLAVVKKTGPDANGLAGRVKPGDNVLVLDRVQDPGNIGSLIRTAAACGYGAVICIKGTGDVYSPKVLRSTAGTIYTIPVVYADSPAEAARIASGLGKRFAVTVPKGGVPYHEAGLASDVALVIGNEGNGVSSEIADAADILVTIPMRNGVESLNAAISGSILMYESIRSKQ